jgi:hypothetical protein
MHGKKKTTTGPLLLRIALILLCMTLFSTSMLSGLYAKYTAKNNGEDSARVAKFNVTADWEDVTVVASSVQTNGEYQFTVTNNSEVAITYDLVITFDQALPTGVSLTLQDYGLSISKDNTFTFSKVASLAPGMVGTEHTLTFQLDLNAFTEEVSDESVSKTVSFTATIRCTQID